MTWQHSDAQAHLEDVVDNVRTDCPQHMVKGDEEVVILAGNDFRRLNPEDTGFLDAFMSGPSFDGVDISRDQNLLRDVEL
ncbi:MAG: prevent-host-death protein [Thermomicrobiales bacterium]